MQAPHVIALDHHILLLTSPNGVQQTFIVERPRPHGRPDGARYHMDTMWDAVSHPPGPGMELHGSASEFSGSREMEIHGPASVFPARPKGPGAD